MIFTINNLKVLLKILDFCLLSISGKVSKLNRKFSENIDRIHLSTFYYSPNISLFTLFETRDGVVTVCFPCFKFVWGLTFLFLTHLQDNKVKIATLQGAGRGENEVMEAKGDSLISGIYCDLLFYTTWLELCQGTEPSDTQEGVRPPTRLTRCTTWSKETMITPRPTASTHYRVGAHTGSCRALHSLQGYHLSSRLGKVMSLCAPPSVQVRKASVSGSPGHLAVTATMQVP